MPSRGRICYFLETHFYFLIFRDFRNELAAALMHVSLTCKHVVMKHDRC